MVVDPAAIRRLARLARVHLEEDEQRRLALDLTRILDFVARLGEDPPASGDAPWFDRDALREDRALESPGRDAALLNAPDTDGERFLVPPVLPPRPGPGEDGA